MRDSVALLATGSEVISGEIVNTNAPHIAQYLADHHITVGQHLSVSDEETDIINGLKFLLAHNRCVITIGGLGPTSDDRTRFAIAKVVGQTLQHHESSWQRIVQRIGNMQLPITETNRVQALFPEHANVYANENGTADACRIAYGEQLIYMLPGPPQECLPLFTQRVLPTICEELSAEQQECLRWRVFGLSESIIAEQVDIICRDFHCETAYRIFHPYLDIKVYLRDLTQKTVLLAKLNNLLAPHCICDVDKTASAMLLAALKNFPSSLNIYDTASGGILAMHIQQAENFSNISFLAPSYHTAAWHIEIKGLEAYWSQQTSGTTSIELSLWHQQQCVQQQSLELAFRNARVRYAAAELSAYQILKWLQTVFSRD